MQVHRTKLLQLSNPGDLDVNQAYKEWYSPLCKSSLTTCIHRTQHRFRLTSPRNSLCFLFIFSLEILPTVPRAKCSYIRYPRHHRQPMSTVIHRSLEYTKWTRSKKSWARIVEGLVRGAVTIGHV